jgi:hypothetical protein
MHRRVSIPQAVYNWALACYSQHGKDHPETAAALAAAKAADPEGWVPQLLAGLTYPPPSMAPAFVPGSKMEAVVRHPTSGGDLWEVGVPQSASRVAVGSVGGIDGVSHVQHGRAHQQARYCDFPQVRERMLIDDPLMAVFGCAMPL